MRSLAGNILRQAGFPKKKKAIAQALLDYVRKAAGYAEDPEFREMVQRATMTLCVDGAPVCIPIGDCDDMTVALGALMRSAGLGVRIAHIQYPGGAQDHVLIAFESDDGQWLNADATTSHPIGYAGAGKRTLIDPLDPKVNPTPYPDGAFVGVGRAPVVGSAIMLPRVFVGAGAVWQSDVDGAIATLDPIMVALNSGILNPACKNMTTANVALWNAAYAKWQKVKNDWEFDKAGSSAPGPIYGGGILARVQLSTNDAVTFQGLLNAACPTQGVPTPINPVVNPDAHGGGSNPNAPDWGDQIAQGAKAVGVLFLVGVGAYGLFQVVSISGAFARAKSAAESIRAPRLSRRAKRRKLRAS
jgi:hypothetical protein